MESINQKLVARLLKRSVTTESGCIEWTGWKLSNGYGMIGVSEGVSEHFNQKGDHIYTHRLMYMAHHGVCLTSTDVICHTCNNRSCINVDHMVKSTHAFNNRHRALSKSAQKTCSRIDKLSPEIAEEIRCLYLKGWTQQMIAEKFLCSQQNVSSILRGCTWNPELTQPWMLK